MIDKLASVLKEAGKPTEIFRNPDGSAALVLPHGGRILGLFAPESEENFFWTHRALASAATARALYDSAEWHNSGGDRTWLAPEVDFFFPDYPDLQRYWQPRALDPGDYRLTHDGDRLVLTNRLKLAVSRTRCQVEVEIRKWLAPAPNPLRRERVEGLAYAGYALHTTLEFVSGEPGARVGLWNLLQLPHDGELLIPTYGAAEPRVFFGTIPRGDLEVAPRLIRYRMRAGGAQKIAIRAVACTGRAGYLYSAGGGEAALVVRNFVVNPSGEYADVPWDDPADTGYCVQACHVCNEMGTFSELEYHAPAIGGDFGGTRYEDVSQVWAFRGSEQAVRAAARCLLAPEV